MRFERYPSNAPDLKPAFCFVGFAAAADDLLGGGHYARAGPAEQPDEGLKNKRVRALWAQHESLFLPLQGCCSCVKMVGT
jgi:hypothetical protein